MRQLKISKQITGRDSYSMERYLMEISRIKTLTPDEEAVLAKRIKQGDREAGEKLVSANLRFVVSVAKQYQNNGVRLEDLINEGNIGLLKAAEFFDETRGFKFISYAVWWIRQAIMQAIAENARLIRLPLNKLSIIHKLSQANCVLEQRLGREPSPEELAEELNISMFDVMENLCIAGRPMSMDTPINFEDDSITINDVYVSQDSVVNHTDKVMTRDSLRVEVKRFFSCLSTREYTILKMYFGLDDNNECSLDEIGEILGISGERVRQVKNRALKKLKEVHNNERLQSFLFEEIAR